MTIHTIALVDATDTALALVEVDITTDTEALEADAPEGTWCVTEDVAEREAVETVRRWIDADRFFGALSEGEPDIKSARLPTEEELDELEVLADCRQPSARSDVGIYWHTFLGGRDISER